MDRLLVFDAGCSVCSNLANTVQDAAGGKLKVIDIRGDEAKSLLDRAHPQGWEWSPYLLTVRRGQVQPARGLNAAARLGLLLGPRKAWHVWSLARRSGVHVPPGSILPFDNHASRRSAIKLAASLAAAVGLLSLRSIPSTSAVECGICPYYCNNQRLYCGCYCGCSAGCVDAFYTYSCYDPCNFPCGTYQQGPYCCRCY